MATSKLQAVNTLLSIVGEAPVNGLTAPLTGDVALADRTLDEISTEIQARLVLELKNIQRDSTRR